MFKYIFLVIFFVVPLSLIAQNRDKNQLNDKGQKTGYWLALDDDGNKKYEGNFMNGHPVDSLKRYYPDGTLKAIMVYDKSGITVNAELFDEEGRIRAKGNYLNKRKDGKWSFYGSKNNLMIEIEYKDDLLNGHGIRYFANGDIMERTNWINGIFHGIQQVYLEGGIKSSEFFYKMGKLNGLYFIYYPDGKKAMTGEYLLNKKEGDWIYYLRNGNIDYTLNYNKGELTNPDVMDQRQKDLFDHYERVKGKIKDPLMYLSDPGTYFRR